jgi:hypothetical protein
VVLLFGPPSEVRAASCQLPDGWDGIGQGADWSVPFNVPFNVRLYVVRGLVLLFVAEFIKGADSNAVGNAKLACIRLL